MDILEYQIRQSFHSAVCGLIHEIAETSINKKGVFRIVLAGGDTPAAIYHRMRELETDWTKWFFYFSDERCYSENSGKLNFKMAKDSLLDHIPISDHQVYRIETYLGANEAATLYNSVLNEVNSFDLMLLGLGEDGHTASLFPGNDLGESVSAPSAIPVFNSPKPPTDRVSLSMRRINDSENVIFLVSGESKRLIVEKLKSGSELPAAKVKGKISTKLFYLTENQ